MAKKITKKDYQKLGGYALGAWGIAQSLVGASNLVRTGAGLSGFTLESFTATEKALVLGVLGADTLSYVASIAFGVLLIVLGRKLVK